MPLALCSAVPDQPMFAGLSIWLPLADTDRAGLMSMAAHTTLLPPPLNRLTELCKYKSSLASEVLRRSVRLLIATLSDRSKQQKVSQGDIVTSPGSDAFLKLFPNCIVCCTLLIAGAVRFRFRDSSGGGGVTLGFPHRLALREEAEDHNIEAQRGMKEP